MTIPEQVMTYAAVHYEDPEVRWDVVVECYNLAEIAEFIGDRSFEEAVQYFGHVLRTENVVNSEYGVRIGVA